MENNKAYEYHGMLASTWDLLRGDMSDSPDQQFFLDIIHEHGEPVLDVGCGTGRLLLDYLAGGIEIDGVDISLEMIELCRQKAREQSLEPRLYVQAIEALNLPQKYRTIIVPSSTFQLVCDLPDARTALDRFHEHLLPGGILALSIWYSKRKGPAEWSDWYLVAEKERPEDGKIIKREERSLYDPETQLRYTENRYELIEDGRIIYSENHRRSPELRNYTLAQLTHMLEQADYTQIQAVSEYSRVPATEEDGTFCIMGRRA